MRSEEEIREKLRELEKDLAVLKTLPHLPSTGRRAKGRTRAKVWYGARLLRWVLE